MTNRKKFEQEKEWQMVVKELHSLRVMLAEEQRNLARGWARSKLDDTYIIFKKSIVEWIEQQDRSTWKKLSYADALSKYEATTYDFSEEMVMLFLLRWS